MPNDNTLPINDSPPIIVDSGDAPPMLNTNPNADNPSSVAPTNDIVTPIMPAIVTSGFPKKKFAGGKVIATILGLFLLVGGIGAGVFLTGQNQDIREKAGESGCNGKTTPSSCNDSCSPEKGDPQKSYQCKWRSASDTCNESSQVCGGNFDCSKATCNPLGSKKCQEQVGADHKNTGYNCTCTDLPSTTQCIQDWVCTEFDTNACPIDDGTPPNTGKYCSSNTCSVPSYSSTCWVSHYRSNKKDDPVVNDITIGASTKQSATLGATNCGAEQIDVFCNAGIIGNITYPNCSDHSRDCSVSTRYPTDCGVNPPDLPTPPPPDITASCQNIKAYSSTWTGLTTIQIGALKAGNTVNFCVTGSASSGSFNKAKFTINGVVQAETTTKRPGGEDFCQSYTIPANTTSFAITALINHITLGWK